MVTMIIILVSTLLNGCSGNESLKDNNSESEDKEYLSLVVSDIVEENLINKLVNQVKSAKIATEDDKNNIKEINEFYIPQMKIEGYKLYSIEINKYYFFYYYAPIHQIENSIDYSFDYLSGIKITIARPNMIEDESNPMKTIVEQERRQSGIEPTKEGYLYEKDDVNGLINVTFQLDNTWARIVAPSKLSFDYNYLVKSFSAEMKNNII